MLMHEVFPLVTGIQYNPLLLAARNGHAKVCRKLLDKRASVNTPRDDKTNFTPLMVAIDEGNRSADEDGFSHRSISHKSIFAPYM